MPTSPKTIVLSFFNAYDRGDYETARACFSPDVIASMPGAPAPMNADGLLGAAQMFGAAFSNRKHRALAQISEGEAVATRFEWRAVHTGDFNGIAPTGRSIAFEIMLMNRVHGGLIVEHHLQFDPAGFMAQLTAAAA